MKFLSTTFEVIFLFIISTIVISIIMFSLFIPQTKIIDNRIFIHSMKDYHLKEEKIINLLKNSPLDSDTHVNAFILPKYLYVLTNLKGVFGSQGIAYPVINTIFINANVHEETERTVEETIVHETTHIDTFNKFGYFKTTLSPSWKVEGIADYVAKSGSFKKNEQEAIIKKYKNGESLSMKEKYVVYTKKVTLFMDKGMSVDELFSDKIKSDF